MAVHIATVTEGRIVDEYCGTMQMTTDLRLRTFIYLQDAEALGTNLVQEEKCSEVRVHFGLMSLINLSKETYHS